MQTRFDTYGHIPDRPLRVRLNKRVIGLMKDELGGKIMTEFVALRPKLYSHKKARWLGRQEVQRKSRNALSRKP